ncbi:hypothetical protein [Umezawaea sp. Da 62-37]|uniref:hypothetical protein n=1 Tax=Umezawaea sp. Da 62-37 TaxID=3075927 RepID=UPI0028F6E4B4|nr:hypothetical protein [Umezawaea sp. Da 62-37]WNV82993.1 hypothetical protein RM788_33020 [Umezawaea sp. Da 62-37]
MKVWKSGRVTAFSVVTGIAASFALAVLPGVIASAEASPVTTAAQSTSSRQLLGTTSNSATYTPTVAASGTYVMEYEVDGVSFYNTAIDGKELGYVGGSSGTYSTRSFELTAGTHTVKVIGPEGYGTVKVYLARVH